jgi:hypothetical protein
MSNQRSSFWAGKSFFDDDVDVLTGEKRGTDVMALTSYRNSIANFVRIVTQQNVPVKFNTTGDSYTDGKSVTISATLSDKDFDHAVGLALHEGSHVVKSDFRIVVQLDRQYLTRYNEMPSPAQLSQVKDLLNIVEDRRIDKWMVSSAPGYVGYYHALYDKYFNTSIINKGLQSAEYRDENWASYFFRVVNITNPNRDLDALKGLKEIWSVLDLPNIQRLKNTQDALNVAFEINDIIKRCIAEAQADSAENSSDDSSDDSSDENAGDSAPQSGNNENAGTGDGSDENAGDGDDDGSKAEGSDAESGRESGANAGSGNESEGEGDSSLPELSDRQKKMLDNAIRKQKEFQDGDIKKKKVSKSDAAAIESNIESGAESIDIKAPSYRGSKTHRVLVIPRITDTILEKNPMRIGMIAHKDSWRIEETEKAIDAGLVMGIKLGKKLKARNEDHSLRYNRLRSGSIDKRRISSLGYGAETVFERIEKMVYNEAAIHISIDASGSMSGEKWNRSVTMACAIAKAGSMIEGLDVVISIRCEDHVSGSSYQPSIMTVYDSQVDNIIRLRKVMRQMKYSGMTPEGLCFAAIQKQLLAMKQGKDGYFLNLSDGMPGSTGYEGEYAIRHTKDQVNEMRKNGLHVISYFVSDRDLNNYYAKECMGKFKRMYGQDSRFVNVESVTEIANTMNAKFLTPKG